MEVKIWLFILFILGISYIITLGMIAMIINDEKRRKGLFK